MVDEPQIFQIEFNEIDGFLYIQSLGHEDLLEMPFDGSLPCYEVDAAQERITWALNKCVGNLDEVKELIKEKTNDRSIQASLVLMIYQSCVSINPSIDMAMWNYMIRQPNLYHPIFDASPFELADPSTVLGDYSLRDFLDPEGFMDNDLFLPDITPPPWASNFKKAKKKEEKKEAKDESTLNVKNIISLEDSLNDKLIGQSEAVSEISKTLKRAMAGLKDDSRPLGVFLFCGSSGCGKSLSAKIIQEHLFGKGSRLVRIDCGEFQQKHEAMKLTGSPASYVGYEDGGQLTNAIKESQNTVLLLDEAEKAHRDFWDIFLKVFDEGYLTDNQGQHISFENTIIIITSNLGNEKIAQSAFSRGTGFNASIQDNYDSAIAPARDYVERETKAAVNKFFKPELVNRLDDVIIFNYLSDSDLKKIAKIELKSISNKIHNMDYGFRWTKTAETALALKSQKAIAGAREMAKIRRNLIENELANRILDEKVLKGTVFVLTAKKNTDTSDYDFVIKQEGPATEVKPVPPKVIGRSTK